VITGEADFEYTWQIGVFLGIFGFGFLFSLIWQTRYAKAHEELDKYERA